MKGIKHKEDILEGVSTLCIELNCENCIEFKQEVWSNFEHDSHWISVFKSQGVHHENIDTNHCKNWLKYLLVCNWIYLNLERFPGFPESLIPPLLPPTRISRISSVGGVDFSWNNPIFKDVTVISMADLTDFSSHLTVISQSNSFQCYAH